MVEWRRRLPGFAHLVPWFIVGFLLLATLRSIGLIPNDAIRPLSVAASLLTIVSMAALGLGVDSHALRQVGAKVTFAVVVSLAILLIISLLLIRALRIA